MELYQTEKSFLAVLELVAHVRLAVHYIYI